jgi:putative DNA methylase
MLNLEDREDPNFGDTDYQLAAYAAALRVLTQYKKIEDIDVMYELTKPRRNGVDNPIKSIIDEAVKIACDYLIPVSFDAFIWKALTAEERFYLRGLDIESRGEYRSGAYQELARGFGMTGYKSMLASGRANQTRLKTATEFGSRQLGDSGFGNSLIRHALFAVREVVRTEQTETGRNWFRNELKESYWNHRKALIEILKYLGNLAFTNMTHWKDDAKAAQLLAVAVENDHV